MLSGDAAGTYWYLEGFVDARLRTWRTLIRKFPLVVGRSSKVGLSLASDKVSNRHAELFARGSGLWIRDLGSTNGTFVNFHRLDGEVELREGDILSFADLGFRLSRYLEVNSGPTIAITSSSTAVRDEASASVAPPNRYNVMPSTSIPRANATSA